ncbi:trypsin-like serine peptidase [Microbispora sp. CA-102843]|uniref:trypsin-like serine peptidase n=1 Tax=Microbispora sp. CA-102843 TaxID=3239952 RepID=UPI003D8E4F48
MKRTLALGGIAAGLLASAAIAAPAHADSVPSVNLANTNLAAQQVAQYWLGEAKANLVNATPYTAETTVSAKHVSTGGASADDKAGVVGSSGDKKASTGTSKNVNLPKTTGKVFFTGADGKPHWCSATSVQSQYKNVVATAGHCVYDTKSNATTLDNWVFVPGYYQGKTPWGIYVGKTAYTHYDYSVYEDGDRDYAFVTVYNGVIPTDGGTSGGKYESQVYKTKWQADRAKAKLAADKTTGYSKLDVVPVYEGDSKSNDNHGRWNNNHHRPSPTPSPTAKIIGYKVVGFKVSIGLKDVGTLGSNVGGQGLAYNQKIGTAVFVFGYPSGSHPDGNYAFTGKTLKWAYGKTFKAAAPSMKAEELVGIKSSFTGEGAIGSSWLYRYSSAKRLGYLNGVTIAVSDTDGNGRIDTSVSPYFDGETLAVYKTAQANWSGKIV